MEPVAPARRTESVTTAFARFCTAQGTLGPPSSHLLIEAYCANGLSGRSEATKGTYRSVLRREAGVVLAPFVPHYRGAPAKAPYRAAERTELASICRSQPRRWRGEAALVVMGLCIGAGLRAAELVAVRGSDVVVETGRVTISVPDKRVRAVAVEAPFAELVVQVADRAGGDHLLHPGEADRRYPNFVNVLCTRIVADPGAPALSVARCRSSYVCDRLAEGTPLSTILASTGIVEVESLLRYAVHVDGAPHSKAALRRALAEGR